MKNLTLFLAVLAFVACQKEAPKMDKNQAVVAPLKLTLAEANNLAKLPLKCVDTEFPNRLGQTLGSAEDLGTPKTLHPAFYGCFDWHSAVHGHWSMVRLLKQFPNIDEAQQLRQELATHLSKANILTEVAYFKGKNNGTYERTYGWAWLLKLSEELHTWDDPLARVLETNLQPLTDVIVNNFITFLPKLNYPIRVGEHPNTAFGMSFAWDYAQTVNNDSLKTVIAKRARDFYLKDVNAPMAWEPGGFDFLSPALEEVDIMRKVLPESEFLPWLHKFLPQITKPDFNLAVGVVSDRTDGNLVHLDGLNFSRAWCLYGLADQYPQFSYLKKLANAHISYSLPSVVNDHYEGGHWLGTYAIYALNAASK